MGKQYNDPIWRKNMRIRVDYNNMMTEYVGEHGISASDIDSMKTEADAAARRMVEKRDQMKWRELPHNQAEIVEQLHKTAEYIRNNCENFVVLGIGGSALGPIAVQQALSHMRYNDLPNRNTPKLFVEDNVDPERMVSLLDVIDVEKSIFNVVSKSGSTSETMAQLLLFVDLLKNKVGDDWHKHIVATTDSKKGNLVKIVDEFNLRSFIVPDGVGGRFSELSPVGLLAAVVCGIDIEELLAGAAYMDELCCEPDTFKNPAYMLALLEVIAMGKGCNISVMMPYADSLRYISDWYAQLWAESLGKRYALDGSIVNVGQTPVKALGVTDQHSQVQLYTEGPFDKVITFLGVDNYRCELTIPNVFDNIPDVAFLSGHTFNELIKAEQFATEFAVMKSGHMSKTITLPEVNAFTIGQLLYLLEVKTAFAGELLGIDAFDQPGVEEGKNATYALLGKKGYDAKKEELDSMPKKRDCYII